MIVLKQFEIQGRIFRAGVSQDGVPMALVKDVLSLFGLETVTPKRLVGKSELTVLPTSAKKTAKLITYKGFRQLIQFSHIAKKDSILAEIEDKAPWFTDKPEEKTLNALLDENAFVHWLQSNMDALSKTTGANHLTLYADLRKNFLDDRKKNEFTIEDIPQIEAYFKNRSIITGVAPIPLHQRNAELPLFPNDSKEESKDDEKKAALEYLEKRVKELEDLESELQTRINDVLEYADVAHFKAQTSFKQIEEAKDMLDQALSDLDEIEELCTKFGVYKDE